MWIIGFELPFQHFLLSKHIFLWNQLESSSTVQLRVIQPSSFPLSPECICIRIGYLSVSFVHPLSYWLQITVGTVSKVADTVRIQDYAHTLVLKAHKAV